MNVPRFWPAVQVLGRTVACNRSDILLHQHTVRFCNQSTNTHNLHNNSSKNSFPNSNFDERLRLEQNLFHTGKGAYLKIVSKSFSTGVQLFCREFTDGENEHAHDILCSLPAYKATTINTKLNSVNYVNTFLPMIYHDKYWPSVSTDELVNTFLSVSKVLFLYDSVTFNQQYYNLFNSLVERIPSMTDDQMLVMLSALSYWPQSFCSSSSKYDELWKTLDKHCSQKVKQWDISKILLIADHWYALRITKLSLFFSRLVSSLGPHILKLSPTQFVQFMFYVNLNREMAVKNNILQKKIKETLKFISIEELGIISMALFKTQTNISDFYLIESIIKFTEKNIDVVSDHSLGSILKLLGKSFPGDGYSKCYNFLESVHPHLHKFNNFVHLQVAIIGHNLLVFHENSFRKVASKFGREMSSLRLKDIERFTYSLLLYQYIPPDCPNILSVIVEELRKPERIVEINHFPRSFSSCVNYLLAMGIFPHDLISAALQPSMVQIYQDDYFDHSDKTFGRELNEIDWGIKIELPPTYLGYKLNPEMSKLLTERFMGRIPTEWLKKLTHQERFLLDVQKKLSAMLGSGGSAEPAIILPHFSVPDLIFCTTREGEPVELPKEFQDFSNSDLKPASKFDHLGLLWNAVIIAGRNSVVRETNGIKGNLLMKKRQLMKLGYHVSVVPYLGYLKSSMKYKLSFLEECLKDSTLNLEGRKDMALSSLKATNETSQSNTGVVKETDLVRLVQQCNLDDLKETSSFSHG